MDSRNTMGMADRIARMQAKALTRKSQGTHSTTDTKPPGAETQKPAAPVAAKGAAPAGDQSVDVCIPDLCDIGMRDSRKVMDVALFRLSKKDLRANARITYDLPDGHITVTSSAHGMASVWDYDIVLMAISHLTEAMNRFRDGKGKKPGPTFRAQVSEVLKFCQRENGGKQKDSIVGSLERLASTFVSIERKKQIANRPMIVNEGENLIARFSVVSHAVTGKVESIEIRVADWIYREVTEGKTSAVLTMDSGYFRIESGIGRYLYRLARRAAGRTNATWSFRTLHERSGSTSKFFEFSRLLRVLIRANALPEYELVEAQGKTGPMLIMTHRLMDEGEAPESEDPG